ncbi:sigma-70 family RNA polymerase sigma factor [Acidovorax sp. CCYZU-2555]|uniref:sigma-70 family RNA polymerase sigma factor n=1 Tax=Acidovorax sp. CCYZU-2555 TaxID=2835042 RepID=UPI001BCC4FAD|nr:sigma-70 family RNA polymerase sigma factor [Acidovorax sp. CCYZU-2555]MBS7779891.1 sigma-70 family RNA polymerase sigma factor [Acidovorax sp. CCYZU-2555]
MAIDALPSPLLASFRANYRDLLRYLSLRTGSSDEARDLAHDTWLRVADLVRAGREPVLKTDGEARAYLFATGRNLLIDQRRHESVARRHAQGAPASAPQTLAPDAAEAAMYGQAIAAVETALAGLPERAREVFVRHRVHGEDQGALALEYGVSRNMIERDMMQAMDRVQAALERWHAGGAQDESAALRRSGRRRSLSALLGLAGLGMGGVGVAAGWRWWRLVMPEWQQMAATENGQRLRLPLPDGSSVVLDAQSRVQIAYYTARRSLQLLAGAAFFDVVADTARPFVVDVAGDARADGAHGSVRITVLGTRFGIERLPGGAVDVQVESGRVRVERLDAEGGLRSTHELATGQAWRGAADADAGEPVVTRLGHARSVAGWRHGVLAFDRASLGETIERLQRYLPHPVDVDAAAAALRLSGQLRITQAEDFLRALPGIIPVRSRLIQERWRIEPRA